METNERFHTPRSKKARLIGDDKGFFLFEPSTSRKEVPLDVKVAILIDRRVLPSFSFYGRLSLVKVVFGKGLHTIGVGAFYGCECLADVKLPSTLLMISAQAFSLCKALRSFPHGLPSGLSFIGENAFEASGLRHLTVPPTVEMIGKYAFANCRKLKSIILPIDLPSIGTAMFYGCKQLRGVEVPMMVEEVGKLAFYDCSSLLCLDFSRCTECMKIGFQAFSRCSKLRFLYLPPNLNELPAQMLTYCSSLTHLRIPPNVVSIGCGSMFQRCASLVSLELPEGLEEVQLFQPWYFGYHDDVTTCFSLVNLYLPPSQTMFKADGNISLPEAFKLGRVSRDKVDLLQKLKLRFYGLPLHKLCYYHSYHPINNTIHEMRDILRVTPSASKHQDIFGMTPLHILALAQTPVKEVLRELFTEVEMIQIKDFFGSTPLAYLCKNHSIKGMDATRWLVWKFIDMKLPFIGLAQWKQVLLDAENRVRFSIDGDTMASEVQATLKTLAQLEFLEVLSLLELFLWKIKLNESVYQMALGHAELPQNIDRHACRVNCGISIVLSNVLPFVGFVEHVAK